MKLLSKRLLEFTLGIPVAALWLAFFFDLNWDQFLESFQGPCAIFSMAILISAIPVPWFVGWVIIKMVEVITHRKILEEDLPASEDISRSPEYKGNQLPRPK